MKDEGMNPIEQSSRNLQDIEYENELLGLSRPAVLVSLFTDKQRLAWILKDTEE